MKYKLQRRKKISKPALNSSKWTVSKLKEEREIENYNNRIKKNVKYAETEIKRTDTNLQWENLKHVNTTASKEKLGKLQQQPRKPWISEKTITLIEQRRKHKHDINKSEYNRLGNLKKIDKLRKIKKNGLDITMKKMKTSLTEEILKSHTTLLESFLENAK